MKINPLHSIDFYKTDHRRQYPDGTEMVYSNFTPRSIKHMATIPEVDDLIVVFGLQYIIKYFLMDEFQNHFFALPKEQAVGRYQRRMDTALGKDAVPVEHIAALHDVGYLPLEIRGLPEGSVVPVRTPVFTIHNTLPEFFWLTNYLETALSALAWKFAVSATTARKYRQFFNRAAIDTGGDLSFVPFQGHDFSFRGMAGFQDAVMSGAAHLLSFTGTDTVAALDFLEDYYGADATRELIGASVPATEHSVMCMGTQTGEFETFERLITQQYPAGIVSIVSDTWDYWQVVTEYIPRLKDAILARPGKVVIRPDSGDPVKIIVGDPEATPGSPEYKGSIECLWETFGGTLSEKGFKILDPHIGLIYGDSITLNRAREIIHGLKAKGFASTNVVLGIGSFTYEYVTRDTLGFAMKATAGVVRGQTRLIAKDPKTDTGTKKSACGFLAVLRNEKGDYILHDRLTRLDDPLMEQSELRPVYRNGTLLVDVTLKEIRDRLAATF